jgi:hypothetical protein
MGGESEGPEDVRQALDRLARLALVPERFKEDPRAILEEYDLGAIPEEVVAVLVDMSPDELRVLAQVHYEKGWVPTEPGVYIFY